MDQELSLYPHHNSTRVMQEQTKANTKLIALKCVDAKSAPTPSTQQAERCWLNTRGKSEACESIFLKLTKDEK
jgi:hypothetical protein